MLDKKEHSRQFPGKVKKKLQKKKKTLPETTTPSVHDKVWIKQYQKPWLL